MRTGNKKALRVGTEQRLQEAGKTNHDFTKVNSINHRISAQIRSAQTLANDNALIGAQMQRTLAGGAA
ncbi:hypothetical protein AB7M17_005562 [Bradyrhizobium sp. USDA 377]